MIACLLLGQLFAVDLVPIELKQKDSGISSRFRSAVSSYALPAAVAVGCTTFLWSQLNPFQDHSAYATPTGWVGGETTGISQLACLAATSMSHAITQTTALQWLSAFSCFTMGAVAQPPPAPTPYSGCNYYYQYLQKNVYAHLVLENTSCPLPGGYSQCPLPDSPYLPDTGCTIDLDGKQINASGMQELYPAFLQLAPSSQCAGLFCPRLNHNTAAGIRVFFNFAMQIWPNLQFVGIAHNELEVDDMIFLNQIFCNLKLEIIYMNNNRLGEDGANAFASGYLQNVTGLKLLDISSNAIGSAGAMSIASALPPYIQYLYLRNNSIQNSGAEFLTSFFTNYYWVGIEMLDVGDNEIDIAHCAALRQAVRDKVSQAVVICS